RTQKHSQLAARKRPYSSTPKTMMAAPYRTREEDPNCCRIFVTSLVISLIPRQGKEYEPCFTSEKTRSKVLTDWKLQILPSNYSHKARRYTSISSSALETCGAFRPPSLLNTSDSDSGHCPDRVLGRAR